MVSAYWEKILETSVRQGCVFSPDLFNLYSEAILRELEDLPGFIIGGHNLNNIRYADDTVLIADTEKKLQDLQRKVAKESVDLFNLQSEAILRELEDLPGFIIGGHNINNIRYADDTVLIADTEKKLQDLPRKVAKESAEKGLSIKYKKTECMVISKKDYSIAYL